MDLKTKTPRLKIEYESFSFQRSEEKLVKKGVQVHELELPYNPSTLGINRISPHETWRYAWQSVHNIHGKFLKAVGDAVICECLVDKENGIFETRSFPKNLFAHLSSLNTNPWIYITIRSKVGTIRIDIKDGSKLVDKKAFELREGWNESEFKDFGLPPENPISL